MNSAINYNPLPFIKVLFTTIMFYTCHRKIVFLTPQAHHFTKSPSGPGFRLGMLVLPASPPPQCNERRP